HYGTGVFEGIRAYWNPKQEQLHLLQAPAHYDRLRRSANIMRLTLPHSTEELVHLTVEVLRRNQFKSDVYIRPLLFTAGEEIGVRLHNIAQSFLIYAIPFGNYVETIVLTVDGHVSEGSAENLFMIKDGAFVTPPVTDDILEGVTRTLLIGLIKDELGLPVIERSIDRTELYA